MYMKLRDGKSKVLTLSYDDGVVQDIRFAEILRRYGIKATFNINGDMFYPEDKPHSTDGRLTERLKASEAVELYCKDDNFEVAIHGFTHPSLELLSTEEIISETIFDRRAIQNLFKSQARGMAYPFGTYNDTVIDILAKCGVCYSRTIESTRSFGFPCNWLVLNPTCHHNDSELFDLLDRFLKDKPDREYGVWMFYLWGHTYEFDNDLNWDRIEKFCERVAGRDDIWYATNIEVYDYVKAYESLILSIDKKWVHNPTLIDVWVYENNKTYHIPAGKTVDLA